jgi:hypothetical protein
MRNEKEEHEEGSTSCGKGEREKKKWKIKREAAMFKTQTKQERRMEVSNNLHDSRFPFP